MFGGALEGMRVRACACARVHACPSVLSREERGWDALRCVCFSDWGHQTLGASPSRWGDRCDPSPEPLQRGTDTQGTTSNIMEAEVGVCEYPRLQEGLAEPLRSEKNK